jgi:hypothetical protein
MPLIESIEQITDGFRVTRTNGAVVELTTADIPNNVKRNLHTPADYENWINNTWLPKLLSYTNPDGETEWYFYLKVHVISLNPMVADARIADNPIPDGWWA